MKKLESVRGVPFAEQGAHLSDRILSQDEVLKFPRPAESLELDHRLEEIVLEDQDF